MPRGQRSLTTLLRQDRLREQVAAALKQGKSGRQVERELKVSRQTVAGVRAELGMPGKRKPPRPAFQVVDHSETHPLGPDSSQWQRDIRTLRGAHSIPSFAGADISREAATVRFHWITVEETTEQETV